MLSFQFDCYQKGFIYRKDSQYFKLISWTGIFSLKTLFVRAIQHILQVQLSKHRVVYAFNG